MVCKQEIVYDIAGSEDLKKAWTATITAIPCDSVAIPAIPGDLKALLHLPHQHLRRPALAHIAGTRLIVEVFGEARFHVDQLAGVAGNAEGVGRSVVSLGETLFDVTNAEYLAVIQVAILIGNFDGVHGLLDLLEIIPCRNAAAYAVLLPFMLD